jgi:hypothetical protein
MANVAVTSGFKPMKNAERDEFHGQATGALATVEQPWDDPGYVDGIVG